MVRTVCAVAGSTSFLDEIDAEIREAGFIPNIRRDLVEKLADTEEGRELCRRWKEWIAAQVKKYEWDIDPDDANHPTIRGLRGTGILARAEQRYDLDHIANDIGMSRQNVDHHMRFRDRMKVAPMAKSGLVWRSARTRPRTPARLYERSNSPGLQNFWPRLPNLRKNLC